MNTRIQTLCSLIVLAACFGTAVTRAQQPVAPSAPAAPAGATAANEAQRQQILQSDRWRAAVHGMEQWLSIQKIYTPQEVAVLRAQFKARIDRMSPAELQDQLTRIEEKLAVLSSPEAEDARRWLGQFLAVQAKYSDAQLRQMRPDIANMTAAQIRQELARFQARRGQMQGTQAATQQGRALQFQSAQNLQAQRRQAQDAARTQAAQSASTAASFPQPSQPPRQQTVPVPIGPPIYTVGPWGNPILWDPMAGFW
jgi:TolA-binding protein